MSMKVSEIQQKYITPKTTGYTALGGIGLTLLSGTAKNRTIQRYHKPLAYISLILTAFHVALTEYLHRQWKNKAVLNKIDKYN